MVEFGSLFAGVGGFDLGFERAGMTCTWQVEIDVRCNEVLAHHWPDVLRLGDIRDCGGHNLPPVDVISFGSPCQDLSVAGKRGGLDGQRSGLFYEAIRIVAELKPTFAVWENVPGALSSNSGRDFAAVLAAFQECGARDIAWRILDAQYFGVAQRRRRVFVVADFGGERAAEILFEPESLRRDSAPCRETGQEVATGVAACLNSGGNNGGFRTEPGEHVIVQHALSGHNQRNDPSGEHFVVTAFDWQSGGDVRLNVSEKHTSALQASQTPAIVYGHGIKTTGYQGDTIFGDGDVWITLSAESANNGGGANAILHFRSGIRRLTPIECERLQGFPDGHTAVNRMKDTPRYRMLGNAVCVPVAAWIGGRILAVTDD